MSKREIQLIKKAKEQYKKIFPCEGKDSLSECFTSHEDKVFFWFNTEDQSTHLVVTDNAKK